MIGKGTQIDGRQRDAQDVTVSEGRGKEGGH